MPAKPEPVNKPVQSRNAFIFPDCFAAMRQKRENKGTKKRYSLIVRPVF
jgi:hypothetical protein